MTALPHVHEAKHVGRILDLVQRATTPGTVSAAHLEANGFPAPAGAQVWAFLQGLGLVDDEGHPTDLWARYRDAAEPAGVLGDIVRAVYAPLLEAVAGGTDDEHPDLERATFTALCERAGIASTPSPDPVAGERNTAGRPRREVLRDLSDLLQRSVDEFEQARRCLTHDLPRPAHVAAWNSFVSLAFAQLADDDFARLRTSPRRASVSVDELLRIVQGSELIRLLIEHELVPAADKGTFDQLLSRRNDCAQPTSVVPDQRSTAAYLNAILGIAAQVTGTDVSELEAPSTPPPPTTPR